MSVATAGVEVGRVAGKGYPFFQICDGHVGGLELSWVVTDKQCGWMGDFWFVFRGHVDMETCLWVGFLMAEKVTRIVAGCH